MSGNPSVYAQAMRDGNSQAWALKWEAAIEAYRTALSEFPEDVAGRNSLAMALYRFGQLDEALAQYQQLLKMAPEDESTLARVAEIQQRRGAVPEIAESLLSLADHYLRNNQRLKAVQTWIKLAEVLPDSLDNQERLYRVVSKAGESALAGRIGLAITRLRGLQASRGWNPLGPSSTRQPTAAAATAGEDQLTTRANDEVVTGAMRQVDRARDDSHSGRLREALLGYARAGASLKQAGAQLELQEVETSAGPLAEHYGGQRFRDLIAIGELARVVVVDRMAASQEHMRQGCYLAAIDECLAGIAAVPEYLPLQARLAEAEAGRGTITDAVARLVSMAELYLLRGDRECSAVALQKAAELGVADTQTWQQLIAALLRVGMREAAVRQLEMLAERLLASGRAGDAIQQLERALVALPDDASVLVRLGQALENAERDAEALETYRRAVRVDQDNLEAALLLSICASLSGSTDAVEEALDVLSRGLTAGGDKAQTILVRLGDAVREHADCLELRLCYGTALADVKNWDTAIGHLEKAVQGNGRVATWARLLLGQFSIEHESLDNAVRQLAEAQRLIGEHRNSDRGSWRRVTIEFQRLWGGICLRRGDLDKALAALVEVKRLAPQDKKVYTELAEVYFRKSDPSSAVIELVALGDLHREKHEPDAAITVFNSAAQLAPANPTPWARLAETYLSIGATKEAMGAMDSLVNIFADSSEISAAVGVLRQMVEHCRETDPSHALRLRERIATLAPKDAAAREELVAAYLTVGMSEKALTEASRLWQDMVHEQRPRDAVAALQHVVQIDPWNAEALVSLGRLHEELGEHARAIEDYRRALAADRSNADAKSRLALLTRTSG